MEHLDNPVWAALTGPQAALADRYDRSARFPDEISMFAGLEDPLDPAAWRDLGALAGPGGEVLVAVPALAPPDGWVLTGGASGVQMVGTEVEGAPDPEAVVLTEADIPEILDLVGRTRPGPFRKRTSDLGTYLGIRREGALVAMAGERLRVPGHTEISAVCTDPAFRGAGLAARLIRAVTANVRERGDTPFLHAASVNTGAIRVYERLGFTLRMPIEFAAYQVPAEGVSPRR
ncbi:GNAT family N-acetyltransferase [Actinoplanes friuliensis]|uniref:Putative acetyltransferase n=1 Tax=Actinoplanes friuliensis DSM 7358 TaxID=1246995 RepID=U5W2D1_9ACTN|nr:GNAT family N-acetyltransferase [Actinoplanes friuliensis]AGZ43172.1 putative acetyltransferase [Actinoplanes friuliensis DSM 7358]